MAAYEVLIATAKVIGDTEALEVFQQNLLEEESMADWLRKNMDETTNKFLRQA